MTTYQTLKEDSDQDLVVENGDLVLITDEDVVRQQLETNYRYSRNNWFLDLNEGLNVVGDDESIIGSRVISEENRADIILTGTNTVGIREISDIEFNPQSDGTLEIPIVFITEFAPEGNKTIVRI